MYAILRDSPIIANRLTNADMLLKLQDVKCMNIMIFFLWSNCSFTWTMHINQHSRKCAFVSRQLISIRCPLAINKSKNRTSERKQQKHQKWQNQDTPCTNRAEQQKEVKDWFNNTMTTTTAQYKKSHKAVWSNWAQMSNTINSHIMHK